MLIETPWINALAHAADIKPFSLLASTRHGIASPVYWRSDGASLFIANHALD